MTLKLKAHAPLQARRGLALNSSFSRNFTVDTPFINIGTLAEISLQPAGGAAPVDVVTKLPMQITPGNTSFRFLWAWGANDIPVGQPAFGQYAIRHNLDTLAPGTYSLSVSGGTLDSTAPDRIEATITTPGNWWITLSGPEGDMPEGWFIEVIKVANEAAYDNTALPRTHVSRNFIPEFLALCETWAPDYWRAVRWNNVENSLSTQLSDYPTLGAYNYLSVWPLELIVALCNHTQSGLHYNTLTLADETFVRTTARYIRDTLDPSLIVYHEYDNESWNYIYASTKYHSAVAVKRYGTQGPGTLSITAGTYDVTATGVDLTTLFGEGLETSVAIGNFLYTVNTASVTPSTMAVRFKPALETVTDGAYHIIDGNGSAIRNAEGFIINATRIAKIWADEFEAGDQRHRLVNLLPTQTVSPARTAELVAAPAWQTQDDFLDPRRYFDAVAVTTYFGKQPGGDTEAQMISLYNAGDQAALNTLWRDVLLGEHPTYAVGETIPSIRAALSAQREVADANGLKLMSYEGGCHAVESAGVGSSPVEIYEGFFAFMQSPEAIEVFEAWRDLNISFFDTAAMHYSFMEVWSEFGNWGLIRRYGWTDNRMAVLAAVRDLDPWWDARFPPQAARVPAQAWQVGQPMSFDLKDYVSVNAESFAGTPPAGTTLSGSVVSGTPTAVAGPYAFTASNGAGSVSVDVPVTGV